MTNSQFRVAIWKSLIALVLVLSIGCAISSEGSAQYKIDEDGALNLSLGGGNSRSLANFNSSAATFDIYLTDDSGGTYLVRERHGSNKAIIVVPLGDDGTYVRALKFSVDMMASTKAGAVQWKGAEIFASEPEPISDSLWDELFATFDSVAAGARDEGSSSTPGTYVRTNVYRNGELVEERIYFSPTPASSSLDIPRLGQFSSCVVPAKSNSPAEYVAVMNDALVDLVLSTSTHGVIRGRYRFASDRKAWTELRGRVQGDAVVLEYLSHEGDEGSGPVFMGRQIGHALRGTWLVDGDKRDAFVTCSDI